MSSILRPPWTRQPQGPVQIDWSNPITRGLKTALSPLYDHAKQQRSIPSGTVEYATRASGKSLKGNNAGLAYVPVSGVGNPVTIMYVGSMTRSSLTNVVAALSVSSGNQVIGFQLSSPAANRVIIRQTNGGSLTSRDYNTNGTTVSSEKVVLCGVFTGSSAIDAYWNGRLDNGNLITGSSGSNTSFNTAALGGVQRATNAYADTGNDGALFCYWNRALTAAEIAKISANPWQLFKPVQRTIAAVISGVTIYRPSSDISLTGWTGVPDNTNLYANIDEVTPSDTDYITSVVTGASPATMGIGPMAAGTYVVRVRAATTSGTGIVRVKLLDSSGTTLGTSADQSITTTPTNYDLSVTTSGTAARVSIEIA